MARLHSSSASTRPRPQNPKTPNRKHRPFAALSQIARTVRPYRKGQLRLVERLSDHGRWESAASRLMRFQPCKKSRQRGIIGGFGASTILATGEVTGTLFRFSRVPVNLSAGCCVYSYADRDGRLAIEYHELSDFDGFGAMVSSWPSYTCERKGIGRFADKEANALPTPPLRL